MQKVVTKEVVDAIPTGRLGINLAALTPGIILGAGGGAGATNTNSLTSQDVGGTAGDTFTDLAIHGSKPSEQRQTIGGVSAATIIRFGESLSSSPSFTAMQEMSLDTSGADASMAGGGVRLNYVPRDGGNTFKGLMFFTGANGSMQATNYTTGTVNPTTNVCSPVEALQCRGLRTQPGAVDKIYDFNPGFGGPSMKDKLWLFATARWTRPRTSSRRTTRTRISWSAATAAFALNNTTLTYNPDLTVALRVNSAGDFKEQTLRISWQINQKNKIGVYYNNKKRITGLNPNTTTSYEALNYGVLLPVLRPAAELVVAGDQQAPARSRRLAPSGDVGRRGRAVRPGRPAGARRHGQQPGGPGVRLHAAHHAVPWPRWQRRRVHPKPQPEHARQLRDVVRDRRALVQGRLRPGERGARVLDRRDSALQHRCQHALEQRTRGRASRCPPASP